MNKFVKIGGAVLVLAGIGIGGLWLYGKGEIEGRMDAQLAKLAERGWTISYGDRGTKGFPTLYAMTLSDLALIREETGLMVRIPSLTAEVSAAAPQQLDVTLPPEITVRMPMTEAMRIAEPALPEVLFLRIESQNLKAYLNRADPAAPELEIAADALSAKVAQDDYVMQVQLAVTGLLAQAKPVDGRATALVTADTGQLTADWPNDIERPRFDATYTELELNISSAAMAWSGLKNAYAAAAADLLSVEMNAALYDLSVLPKVSGETVTTFTSTDTALRVSLDNGVLTYDAQDLKPLLDIRPRPPRDAPQDATKDQAIRIAAVETKRRLVLPLGPAGTGPQPAAFTLTLTDAGPDDATWARLDPETVLPRDPSQVTVKTVGTMAHVRDGAWGLPVEFANITIEQLTAESMGATANLTGDVEILQPIGVPFGGLTLTLDRPGRLLGHLHRSGLLPQAFREMGDAMLQVYAVPGAEADSYTVPIEFSYEGIKVNGRRVP